MADSKTAKKLTGGIITVIVLAVCLCVTTYALVWASVSVENNLFHTGAVEIDLNGGEAIIREDEFRFEPGMTVVKNFYVKNNSTDSVYYRLYMDNVAGGLADVLQITLKDGSLVLWQGTANELNRRNVAAADEILQVGQKKTLTAEFYFPRESGNEAKNLALSFDLCAEATQTKNNPNGLFD